MQHTYDLIIVGGGAAGFFGGIQYLEKNPQKKVAILESSKQVLSKVRISGGGRCNVLHAAFDPTEIVGAYPRGSKELRGPFSRYCTGDVWEWFEQQGVALKIEDDGRVFPKSNSSETIVACLNNRFAKLGGKVFTQQKVIAIQQTTKAYALKTGTNEMYASAKILWTTGGTESAWKLLERTGVACLPRVPSLFSFNLSRTKITELAGISVPLATVSLPQFGHSYQGPLLITHWGFSGPAVLKLSAYAAKDLAEVQYQYQVAVNWLGQDGHAVRKELVAFQARNSHVNLSHHPFDTIPKRLWQFLLHSCSCTADTPWQHLSKKQVDFLAAVLTHQLFEAKGKTTYKEEFVTAGGIDTRGIDMKRMELKAFPGFFVAGEVVNIDGITGGFNFQNAWTTSWIAAQNI